MWRFPTFPKEKTKPSQQWQHEDNKLTQQLFSPFMFSLLFIFDSDDSQMLASSSKIFFFTFSNSYLATVNSTHRQNYLIQRRRGASEQHAAFFSRYVYHHLKLDNGDDSDDQWSANDMHGIKNKSGSKNIYDIYDFVGGIVVRWLVDTCTQFA